MQRDIGLQKWMKTLSEEVCLASCYYYLSYGNNKAFFLQWLGKAIEKGDIAEDGYVVNPNNLTGKLVYKCDHNPTDKEQIARFYNPRTGYSHFVVASPDGIVVYDPLEESVTVKEGLLQDWRIIE